MHGQLNSSIGSGPASPETVSPLLSKGVAAAVGGGLAPIPPAMQQVDDTSATAATDKVNTRSTLNSSRVPTAPNWQAQKIGQPSPSIQPLPSLQTVQNMQGLHAKFLSPYFAHITRERGLSANTQQAYSSDLTFFLQMVCRQDRDRPRAADKNLAPGHYCLLELPQVPGP